MFILHGSIYRKFPGKATLPRQKADLGSLGAGSRHWMPVTMRELSGVMKCFTTGSWSRNFINFITGKFLRRLYLNKNHSLDSIANMFVFHLYIASVTSTAGNQWLHFLTGRMLIASIKHAKKIILLSYSKGYVFPSPTDWWTWVTLRHLASETKRCQDGIVCYSYQGRR